MVYGNITGDMPPGTMKWEKNMNYTCTGYEGVGSIMIRYEFPDGKRPDQPGVDYTGTARLCYLPNNKEGQEVLALLEKAFLQRVSFVIGTSVTTGQQNTVIWGSIHHKTNTNQGAQRFGYPDPTYLNRVTLECADHGVKLIQNDPALQRARTLN